MELLVLRVAQHQAIVASTARRPPRCSHSIHQAKLGLLVELVGFLLLGDIEDNADQMRFARLVARRQGGAGLSQTQ